MLRLNILPHDIIHCIFDFVDPSISSRLRRLRAEENTVEMALTMVAKNPLHEEFTQRMSWWRFASPMIQPARLSGYRSTQKQVQDIIAMWEREAEGMSFPNLGEAVLYMHDNALTSEFITDTNTYPVCALLRIGRSSRRWKARHKHLPHPYLK